MDFWKEFEDDLYNQDRSENTIRSYLADLKHFVRWFEQTNGETFTVESITPTDVREYRQFMLVTEEHKPSTINRKLAALSALMAWARKTGKIDHDPTENIRSIRLPSPIPRYLDKKEQNALLRTIEKDIQIARLRYRTRWISHQRDGSLIIFLLHTGLRISEALNLKLSDIELSERKGLVRVRQAKGITSRVVPLNATARKALQDWLAVRPETGIFLWTQVEKEPGSPLTSRTVQRILKRIGTAANLPHLTPHVLRHTFAKNLVDQGVGLEKVATLMGHANLNTTRIYTTPSQKDLESAVEKMAEE